MPIARTIVFAMTAAGALGGLAGAIMLQGDQYALKSGFSSGYGFDGLVVGLLARGSIPGVFAGALLFGFLRSGGINMEMAASVPSALVQVVQGLIILTVAGAALWADRKGAGK
jgi:simple sugar transport system permease protein